MSGGLGLSATEFHRIGWSRKIACACMVAAIANSSLYTTEFTKTNRTHRQWVMRQRFAILSRQMRHWGMNVTLRKTSDPCGLGLVAQAVPGAQVQKLPPPVLFMLNVWACVLGLPRILHQTGENIQLADFSAVKVFFFCSRPLHRFMAISLAFITWIFSAESCTMPQNDCVPGTWQWIQFTWVTMHESWFSASYIRKGVRRPRFLTYLTMHAPVVETTDMSHWHLHCQHVFPHTSLSAMYFKEHHIKY